MVFLAGMLASRPASAQFVEVSGQPNLGTVNLGSSISETFVLQAQSAIQTSSKAIAVTEGVRGLDFSVSSDNCNTSVQTGDFCQIVVSFTPTVAGQRLGNITKRFFSGMVLIPIYGVGYGPQVAFGPPTAISIGPSLNGALLGGVGGVALDAAGDLFISDPSNVRVVKVPASGGAAISIPPVSESYQLTFPTALAVDGAGNLYIGNSLSSENPFGGSYVVVAEPNNEFGAFDPNVNGLGISYVSALAVDGAGDVFIADCGNTRVIEYSITTGVATAIDPTVNGVPLTCALGLAIDNSGDLLIADSSNDRIVQITNLGAGTASVLDTGVGLNYPYGLAVDAAGNLFIAEPNINVVLEVPADGGNAIQVGSGLNFPNSVAVDGVGDLFISDGKNDRVLELQRPTAPSAAFGTPTIVGTTDTTDGTQTVQVVNIGNAPLTIGGVGYPADFAPATDANACTGSTVLASDQECDIALLFAPLSPASGPLSESVTLTDDSMNGTGATQSIVATGTAVLPLVPATLSFPTPGLTTVLGTSGVVFQWSAGTGVTQYQLSLSAVGSGQSELYLYKGAALTTTVPTLPASGVTVYATLSSKIGGVWQSNPYLYTESGSITPAAIASPTPGLSTILGATNVTFQWNAGSGATVFQLNLSAIAPGQSELYSYKGTAMSATAPSLPANGVTLYARLYSFIQGAWQSNDYVYTESGTPLAVLQSPTPGLSTVLGTSLVAFQWSRGTGVTVYQLNLSSIAPGDSDLFLYKGSATTATASSLPANGVTVYARLYSYRNSAWLYNDYVYTETGSAVAAVLTSPTPSVGTVLGTNDVGFQWTAGIGVTVYQLNLSAIAPGDSDLYSYKGAALSATAATLPANGVKVYARLYSNIDGVWLYNDYVYTEQ
jgi:sugar lactone lactonase YvrE